MWCVNKWMSDMVWFMWNRRRKLKGVFIRPFIFYSRLNWDKTLSTLISQTVMVKFLLLVDGLLQDLNRKIVHFSQILIKETQPYQEGKTKKRVFFRVSLCGHDLFTICPFLDGSFLIYTKRIASHSTQPPHYFSLIIRVSERFISFIAKQIL